MPWHIRADAKRAHRAEPVHPSGTGRPGRSL